jgi:hypothetical protein
MSQLRRRLSVIFAVGVLIVVLTATAWADTIQVDGDIASPGQGNTQACLIEGTGDTITANLNLKYNGNDHFFDGTVTITPSLDGGRGSSFITATGGSLTLSGWSASDQVNTDLTITIADDWAAKSATDVGPYKILYTLTQIGNSYAADNSSNMNAVIINGDACSGGGGGNQPPVLISPGDQTVAEGNLLSFNLAASDPDGDALTYSMSGHRSVSGGDDNMSIDASTGAFAWTPGDNYPDYSVTFTVSDGSLSDSETVTIRSTNVDPDASNGSLAYNPYTGVATAGVSFSDAGWHDSHSALFDWGNGSTSSGTAGAGENAKPDATGSFSATYTYPVGCSTLSARTATVTDDDNGSDTETLAPAGAIDHYTVTFEAPIKDGERNYAKLGMVVPVKLRITDCNGNPVLGKALSIRTVQGNVYDESTADSEVITESVSNADTSGIMRQVDGKYMYNLSTKGLLSGKDYTIVIKDGTQFVASALLQPKK